MSSKKTTIINNNLFVNNINILVDANGDKYDFAAAIGVSYDAVRQWCIGENLPDGKRLLAIKEQFGISIDWLLTGKENNIVSEPVADYNQRKHYHCDLPKEICEQVKEIIDSNHPVIKPALISNLAAFQYSIRQEKSQDVEIGKLNKRVRDLEDAVQNLPATGTDQAASSSTGKQGT